MNNYKHFGELLEQLRLSNNMTQVEASEGICTLRQYSRLEKGQSTPRIDILYGLSNKFNTNLYDYYNIHFCHQSFEAYQCIKDLNDSILANNYANLDSIISRMNELCEFNTGDNYKNLCYAEALSAYDKGNYKDSISLCLKGLALSDFNFFAELPENQIYTNIELCLMNCLGCNMGCLQKYKEANIAFRTLVDAFDYQSEKMPFSSAKNSDFVQNSYENAIYNISYTYYRDGSLDLAYGYVQKGINFSMLQNHINYLPSLLELKGYILIALQKTEEARDCWIQSLGLLKLNLDALPGDKKSEYIQQKYTSLQTQLASLDKPQ